MAIGGLISNKNFSSFVGSGKVCTTKQAVLHQRAESLVNLWTPRINGSRARCAYGRVFHAIDASEKNQVKSRGVFHENDSLSLMSPQSGKSCCSNIPKQRIRVKCDCYLSSNPSCSSWCQFKVLDKLDIRNAQFHKSKNVKTNKTRAYYKSEEYDITEAKVDALPAIEGPGEAVVVEGDLLKASPWWQQFPKRWVIVLLCFTAFLLCNMDRVNMSIAILPMSKEFNWNSATVGLIQSSFFLGLSTYPDSWWHLGR